MALFSQITTLMLSIDSLSINTALSSHLFQASLIYIHPKSCHGPSSLNATTLPYWDGYEENNCDYKSVRMTKGIAGLFVWCLYESILKIIPFILFY